MQTHLLDELQHIAHSLFQKNFFSVYHGSISARTSRNSFLINTKEVILDALTPRSFVALDIQKRDYRWHTASGDVHIHEQLYAKIENAKYISYTMPPYATAYAMKHGKVHPADYYGKLLLGEIIVYDPEPLESWMERAPHEIAQFFTRNTSHLLLIRGFGLISYDRNLIEMAKKISILENSCRLLALGTMM